MLEIIEVHPCRLQYLLKQEDILLNLKIMNFYLLELIQPEMFQLHLLGYHLTLHPRYLLSRSLYLVLNLCQSQANPIKEHLHVMFLL